MIDDERIGIDNGLTGFEGLLQGTVVFTNVGVEDVAAGAIDGILAGNTRGAFSGMIKRGDTPVQINGKYAFIDRIENDIMAIFFWASCHSIKPQSAPSLLKTI
jgi:hypothetical protein